MEKRGVKNNLASGRVSELTLKKLEHYAKETGTGIHTLVGVGAVAIVHILDKITEELKNSGAVFSGTPTRDLFRIILERTRIYDWNEMGLLMGIFKNVPVEDIVLSELRQSISKSKKKKGGMENEENYEDEEKDDEPM